MALSRSIYLIGLLALFVPSISYSQLGGDAPMPQIKKSTGPSLDETIQWITQKFDDSPPARRRWVNTEHDYKYRVSFESCYVAMVKEKIGDGAPVLEIYYFALNEMDTDQITTRAGEESVTGVQMSMLSIPSLGRKEVIRYKLYVYGSLINKDLINREIEGIKATPPRILTFVNFLLPDLEVAERIASAFKHAGMLCQKKAAEAKAAQPAKPKELF